jgi:O-antigen/teichoic acid export membrane protein
MIARLSERIERLLCLALSRTAPRDERERRSRSVVRGTISAVLARGLGSLTGLITVPLTVGYLGSERYGIWMTISSVLIFLGFTDLGLASSLTNVLGKAFGEDDRDRARRYVSTALLILSIIAALLVIAAIIFATPLAELLFPNIDSSLMRREVVPALVIALAIFALNFPLLVANRVLAAYQESARANLWIMAGSVANLAGILVVIWYRGGLPWLVLGYSGLALVVSATSTIWLFGWHKRWLLPAIWRINSETFRDLFSSSWKFFIINTGWLINSQTDNFIIAHYLGPAQVTPYSVTFRLFAYATLIQALAFPSMWPAYTEAAARNDFDWMRGMYQKNLRWSLLIAIAVVGILTIFGQTIIRIWAGPLAVPPFSVIVWMAIWNLMLAHLVAASCLLQATGHITGLSIYCSVTAVLNIALSVFLVRPYGVSGVIAATVIAYAAASFIPVALETRIVLGKFRMRSPDGTSESF